MDRIKAVLKKTFLWFLLKQAKISYQRFQEQRWRFKKFDGKPLTSAMQKEIQSIMKNSKVLYNLDEKKARKLADDWHGQMQRPDNIRFIDDAVPVVLSANDSYAPYVAVMLQSLLDVSNPQRKYHFIIFENDFSDTTKQYLLNQMHNFSYCTIDFINTKHAFKKIPVSFHRAHFSNDIFSRFFIPYWLSEYPKVIYCDSDMLAKADIANLYDFDIQNFCMGATINQWISTNIKKQNFSSFSNFAAFSILDNWSSYINSGLLLFNTKVFREKFSYNELFKFAIYYTNRYKNIFPDQDVLSLLVKDDYFIIPPEWNYCWEKSIKLDANSLQTKETNHKIIHFTSNIKPWKDIPEINNHPDAIAYRNYAKEIPLYNLIHNKPKSN